MICALVGSPYLPDFRNTILVLEDVGEQPYEIDRKLMHLKLAGILEKVSGIVLGQFADCEPRPGNPSLSVAQILHDTLSGLGVPIVEGLKYGHVDMKYTLPLGLDAHLDAQEGSLEIKDSAVA